MTKKIILFSIVLFLIQENLYSQDRSFAKTYTSNVLPKNTVDIEFWHTSRIGHQNQYFFAQDQRLEVEFGLGKNIQTAIYFNQFHKRFSESTDGTKTSSEIGFSNEWKWKLSDPVANKVGFALYGECGIKGGDELELETKLIFDKIVGKNLFAFNAVLEYEKEFEWTNSQINNSWTMPFEFDFGYQYTISKHVGLGLELTNYNKYTKANKWEYSALFLGPVLNFKNNNWFIIANYQPQIQNIRKTASAPFSKVLDDRERMEARILVGITL